MSRIKITEYAAKRILIPGYAGVPLRTGKEKLPNGKLVVKVDQGVKKRMKHGLLKVGVTATEAKKLALTWRKKGFTNFLVEPVFEHNLDTEQYLSLERVRNGVRLLHSKDGGIDIESHPEAVTTRMIATDTDIRDAASATGTPEAFLRSLLDAFNAEHMAFLELNPLVVMGDACTPLDAAVLVDSAATEIAHWKDGIVADTVKHPAEARVRELASTTPASLKLSVINPDGALFLLLSGGGGSIVIADEAQLQGVGHMIANYGEYSGGPSREETYLYAKEVLSLLIDSRAKRKALVIAGGVANFTDVHKTFAGIIDALKENAARLKKQGVRVFVRRGGPNEKAGLAMMRGFLESEGLFGSVYGSDAVITSAVADAIRFVRTV
jgi:ATP-citrate lyase beta-subunit